MHLTRLRSAQSALCCEGEGCFEEQNALKKTGDVLLWKELYHKTFAKRSLFEEFRT